MNFTTSGLIKSIWYFIYGTAKRFYLCIPAIIFLFIHFSSILKTYWRFNFMFPVWVLWTFLAISLFMAIALTYHELRMQNLNYEKIIEVNKEHEFKELEKEFEDKEIIKKIEGVYNWKRKYPNKGELKKQHDNPEQYPNFNRMYDGRRDVIEYYQKIMNYHKIKKLISSDDVKLLVPKNRINILLTIFEPIEKEIEEITNDLYDPKVFRFYEDIKN